MKREGRQHGMVRSFRIPPEPLNPRPKTRFVNKFDSPPTAGLFTKVSSRPTNHSKYTGRCGSPRCSGCHLHPACKSKGTVKGTHKHKSSDDASKYRLVTFRVVDERPGFHAFGFSATGLVDHIYDDDDYCSEDEVCEFYEGGNENNYWYAHELEVRSLAQSVCDDYENVRVSEMGFEIEEDEGWYLVKECL